MRWSPLLLLAALGCGPAETEGPTLPTLRIGGSDAATRSLIPALAQSHVDAQGTMRFEVSGGESGEGIRRLMAGELDLAASARGANPNEQEQARANGYDLDDPSTRHIVGVDVVAVAVHPGNPIDNLTYDQVIGIFCTREIDNWSFLGLDPQPIRVVSRPSDNSTRALFEDFFCGPRGIHVQTEEVDVDQIDRILGEDETAISFISLSEGSGKTIGLRPDPAGPAVRPSQQNIIRGAYPLYHDVYLLTAGKPGVLAKAFLDYVASPAGQEIVDEQRFVPLFLRPERLDEARPLRETIHFEMGAIEPNQRSTARLQLLVDELRDRAGEYRHVVLEGYTDNREPEAAELSTARAVAVRDLLKQDLPGMYFEIIPRGAANPIAPNDTPYGRQRNRRVQIYLAAEEAESGVEVTANPGG